MTRLKSYFRKWVLLTNRKLESVDDILDLIYLEQLYDTLSADLAIKVRESEPSKVEDAAHKADIIIEAKKANRISQEEKSPTKEQKDVGCHNCGKPDHYKRDCPLLKKSAAIAISCKGDRVQVRGQEYVDTVTPGTVNGSKANFLRDTGSSLCLVKARFVKDSDYVGRRVSIGLLTKLKLKSTPGKVKMKTYSKGVRQSSLALRQ